MARARSKRAVQTSARPPKPKGPTPAQEAAALRRQVAKLEREKAELETKAARPVDAASIPTPPPSSFAALPPPPKDPLAAQEWMGQVLLAATNDAIHDTKLSPRERRKEIRTNAAALGKTVPDARRWRAEQAAKAHRKPIDQRASTKAAPDLKPIP